MLTAVTLPQRTRIEEPLTLANFDVLSASFSMEGSGSIRQ